LGCLVFHFLPADYHASYLYARLLILAHLGYVASLFVANSISQKVANDAAQSLESFHLHFFLKA